MTAAPAATVAAASTGCHGFDNFPVLRLDHIDHADLKFYSCRDSGLLPQGKLEMADGFTKRAGGHIYSNPITDTLAEQRFFKGGDTGWPDTVDEFKWQAAVIRGRWSASL